MRPSKLVEREFNWDYSWEVHLIFPEGIPTYEAQFGSTGDQHNVEARRFMSQEVAINWAKREVMLRRMKAAQSKRAV